jgi:nitroreductase
MNEIFSWIPAHPVPTALIFAVLYLVVISFIAFLQGRSISIFPPKIGGRRVHLKADNGTVHDETGVFNVITARKSIRMFLDKPVEADKMNRIFEAARLAPSASNRQEWRFVVLDDKQVIGKVALASCIQTFIGNAPAVIAACAETGGHVMQCGQPSYPIDVAIALDHISLAAVALGLGTCWIGMFGEAKVKKILGIPEKVRVVALMVLGYPADPAAEEKKRLPMEKIVKYNKW